MFADRIRSSPSKCLNQIIKHQLSGYLQQPVSHESSDLLHTHFQYWTMMDEVRTTLTKTTLCGQIKKFHYCTGWLPKEFFFHQKTVMDFPKYYYTSQEKNPDHSTNLATTCYVVQLDHIKTCCFPLFFKGLHNTVDPSLVVVQSWCATTTCDFETQRWSILVQALKIPRTHCLKTIIIRHWDRLSEIVGKSNWRG